jgi:hypothetical protein
VSGYIKIGHRQDGGRLAGRRLPSAVFLSSHQHEKTVTGKTVAVLSVTGKTAADFYVATKKTVTGQLKVSMFKLFHNYILI